MVRELSPNRWNWSQEDGKWIYIELNHKGEKIYHSQLEPPSEFKDLTMRIKILNEKLIVSGDPQENDKIFDEMMKISKKMQCMGKSD